VPPYFSARMADFHQLRRNDTGYPMITGESELPLMQKPPALRRFRPNPAQSTGPEKGFNYLPEYLLLQSCQPEKHRGHAG